MDIEEKRKEKDEAVVQVIERISRKLWLLEVGREARGP